MEQLVMKASAPFPCMKRQLPDGYRFVNFSGSDADIADWKRIIMEPPSPPDGADSCYHLMIEIYPDVVPVQDIYFVENADVLGITTQTLFEVAEIQHKR